MRRVLPSDLCLLCCVDDKAFERYFEQQSANRKHGESESSKRPWTEVHCRVHVTMETSWLLPACTARLPCSLVTRCLLTEKRESSHKFKTYKIGRFLLLAFSRARIQKGHHTSRWGVGSEGRILLSNAKQGCGFDPIRLHLEFSIDFPIKYLRNKDITSNYIDCKTLNTPPPIFHLSGNENSCRYSFLPTSWSFSF